MINDTSITPQLRASSAAQDTRIKNGLPRPGNQRVPDSTTPESNNNEGPAPFHDELQKSGHQSEQEQLNEVLASQTVDPGAPSFIELSSPTQVVGTQSAAANGGPLNPLTRGLNSPIAENPENPGPVETVRTGVAESLETNAEPPLNLIATFDAVSANQPEDAVPMLPQPIANSGQSNVGRESGLRRLVDSQVESTLPQLMTPRQAVADEPAISVDAFEFGEIQTAPTSGGSPGSQSGFQFEQGESSPAPFEPTSLSMEPSNRALAETSTRTASPTTSSAAEIGRAVSQRVTEVLIQEISLSGNNESKQITLHLNPAELGRLTLQIGWEADSIIARIVASELATSEMLNQDKRWLIDALQESGLELDSFDISHGKPDEQNSPQENQTTLTKSSPESDRVQTEPGSIHAIESEGLVVNLIA